MVILARLLFRACVLFYGTVLMVAAHGVPLEVPAGTRAGTQPWAARADSLVLLAGAGLAAALFVSAVASVLQGLPLRWVGVPPDGDAPGPTGRQEARRRVRSELVQDVYLVGIVAMLVLSAVAVGVARQTAGAPAAVGPHTVLLAVLAVAGLLGLAASRRLSRPAPAARPAR